MKYYSVMKREDILPFTLDLEHIVLGRMGQTERDRYCVMSLI